MILFLQDHFTVNNINVIYYKSRFVNVLLKLGVSRLIFFSFMDSYMMHDKKTTLISTHRFLDLVARHKRHNV